MMRAIRVYALAYPFAVIASLYVTWFAGRLSLGHWPQRSIDDPKEIGGWFELPNTITGILLIPGAAAFVFSVAALFYGAYRRPGDRTRLLTTAAVSVFFAVAAELYLRWDPLRISYWFWD